MIKSKTFIKAFIIGAIEVNNRMGGEALYDWLWAIGDRLGELEGGGIEGRKSGDLYYDPICPLKVQLETEHYFDILSKRGDSYLECPREGGIDKPACGDIMCIMHYAYRRKRGELAGKKVFHLMARSHLTEDPIFNEDAIKAAGKTKKDIEDLMQESACIFAYR